MIWISFHFRLFWYSFIFLVLCRYTFFLYLSLQEKDPFWEPAGSSDVLIGSVHVYLQSLAYQIELQENLAITDYKGNDQGHLLVEIIPCDNKWKDLPEDVYVEDPKELVRHGKTKGSIVALTHMKLHKVFVHMLVAIMPCEKWKDLPKNENICVGCLVIDMAGSR